MKLLVISSVLPPFNAAEADYTWQFCRRLVEQGHQVTLLTNARDQLAAPPGVTVRAVMKRWTARAFPRLAYEMKRANPQGVILLYIGWMYDRHPLTTFLPTLTRWLLPAASFASVFFNRYGAARKEANVIDLAVHKILKAATGERGLIYEYGTLFTESHRVFALSAQHAEVFQTVWPAVASRLEVLPSLPLLAFSRALVPEARRLGRTRLGATEPEFLLVFFGYVYPSKGLETFFAALSHLPNKFRLAIVGGVLDEAVDHRFNDYASGLRSDVKARGLENRVQWTGSFPWDSETASEFLHAADAIVLPFDEGISLNNSSFAAAAWHARPVVSTLRKDTEPEFRDGENILLVPPLNPQALAAAIQRVADQPILAKKIAQGARALAEKRLNWDVALDQVVRGLTAPARRVDGKTR